MVKRVFEYIVGDDYAGKNIKTFLIQHYKMSSKLIVSLKSEYDGICVNGEHKNVTYLLNKGDEIIVSMYEKTSENIVSANISIDIVYEDEDLVVINKPPNMPTHPSMGNHENTLANGLMYYWRNKGEDYVFRAVNRLDKDTSGLMVVAKNAYTHAQLSGQIIDDTLKRKYSAIVCGNIENDGTINAPIDRESDSIIKRCVCSNGQHAITHYKVIQKLNNYTLLELQLETGRTHQIRVHMSHIGHPIVGDFLYGEENHNLMPRQALHSCYAEFFHPVKRQKMLFYQQIPKDMKEFIEKYNING